jgi:signal peptidase
MRILKTCGQWLLLGVATLLVLTLLFLNVGPRLFPYQALIVRSGSMAPTIPTGSLNLYRKVNADQLHVGQIILFTDPLDPSVQITHRIYAIQGGAQGRYFITKGDANAVPDNWQVPAVGSGWTVFWHVPDVGYALSALESTDARVVLIGVPIFLLLVLEVRDRTRKKRPRGRHSTGMPAMAAGEGAADSATR